MNKVPYELIVTDVDGVLTNGRYLYDVYGKQYKEFGPHDADGVKFFRKFGVEVLAISADKRGFPITEKRLKDMGVPITLVSENDRLSYVNRISNSKRFAFIGDGYFDISSLLASTVGYAPSNALDVVKKHADVVLPICGGEGVLLAAFEHFLSIYDLDSYNQFINGGLTYG